MKKPNDNMNKKKHIFANLCLISSAIGLLIYLLLIGFSFFIAAAGVEAIWPVVVIILVAIGMVMLGMCMYNNCCKKFKKEKETTNIY